jgi:hypothetical protein
MCLRLNSQRLVVGVDVRARERAILTRVTEKLITI